MRHRDAEFWDQRYVGEGYAYGEEPNAFMASQVAQFSGGQTALVPADGEGRNGVWLAERGLTVTTLDQSSVGVEKAKALATDRDVSLSAHEVDVFEWNWPDAAFDHIVLIYFHLPPEGRYKLHCLTAKALRPGGRITLQGFAPKNLIYRAENPKIGGPPEKEMLFTAEMLREDFVGLHPVLLEERDVQLKEGKFHEGTAAVVNAIFEKEV